MIPKEVGLTAIAMIAAVFLASLMMGCYLEVRTESVFSPYIPERVHGDEEVCWNATVKFQSTARDLGTIISCIDPLYGKSANVAGLYSGTITIISWPGNTFEYYQDIIAHELGHAYDEKNLNAQDRLEVQEILGWETWDGDHYSDIYALHIGHWNDYGDGWRHEGEYPTGTQMSTLSSFLPG